MNSLTDQTKSCWGWFRNGVQLLGAVFAIVLTCQPAFSQGSFGRILGTVTDQSGGVVAGAMVSVIDTERGATRSLIADVAGEYNAPNLTAGNYTIRVDAKGFKRLERQNVVVEIGKEVRIDLVVQPGEQNQTVTVTESVPLVETTNATQGGTLENSDIINLPLNGRDYQNLLGLRPGVMLQPGGGPWTQSANGVRPDESVWLIEGIINANFFDARPLVNMPSPFTDGATILPVDAIQEFNLMENPKAEYGWKAGAIVNVGIKSGTNQLHGDAYAFGRYQNWDARNYFNIAAQNGTCALNTSVVSVCDQTPAQLEQFGAVVGGPIKKDKLFFFGGYEGLRSFIGFVGGLGVPATASQANISGNGPAGNPASSMVDAINSVASSGGGFNPALLSTVSMKLAGCTTGATAAATVCTGNLFPNTGTSNNFLSTFPTTNTSDNGIGKLNYHLNEKNTFNGMFFYGHYNATGEDHPFAQVQSTDTVPIRALTITSSWVYTPNSSVVNEARFGYGRISFNFVNIDVGVPASTYGLNTGVTNPLAGGLPSITIAPYGLGGTPVIGTAFNRPQYFTPNPYFDLQDSISVLKGKHSIKIGGEIAHLEADAQVFNNGRGRFDFPSLQAYFQGAPSGTLLTGTPLSKLTAMNYIGFIQDDWRITPRLNLNLGMRYSFLTPMKDANNNLGNFDPSSPSGMVQQGQAGVSTIWKADPFDFEPRLGLAWDLNGKGTSVVRVGFGFIHETWNLATFELQFGMQGNGSTAINAIPTAAAISCGITVVVSSITCPSSGGGTINLGSATFPASQLCWDPSVTAGPGHTAACAAGQTTIFPTSAGQQCGDGVTSTVGGATTTAPTPCDLMSVNPNLKLPVVMNYNLGFTHAFGPDISLEVEYVGNHGYRLLNFADINQAPLGAANCLNTLTAAQIADACGPNRANSFSTTTTASTTPCTVSTSIAINNCLGSGLAMQESRPFYRKFPYLGYIYNITNRSYSNYNSLQVSLTKRVTHGLAFTAGYTYGHGLDSGSLNRFGLNPQNSENPAAGEYGSSDFDVRNRVTVTATYDIPGKKGYGQMLEGWQVNVIGTYATPQPWQTYDFSDNFSGTFQKADRWNIFGNSADFYSGKNSIPDCTVNQPTSAGALLLPFAPGNVSCTVTSIYGGISTPATAAQVNGCLTHSASSGAVGTPLDIAGCYISANGKSYITPPALGTFGNMGRNILRDSGFSDVDFSIFKNFTIKDHYGVQARWEVFNTFNHPVAANPSGASSFVNTNNQPGPGAVFGTSLLTPDFAAGNPLIGSGSQRVMQIGLKITF